MGFYWRTIRKKDRYRGNDGPKLDSTVRIITTSRSLRSLLNIPLQYWATWRLIIVLEVPCDGKLRDQWRLGFCV